MITAFASNMSPQELQQTLVVLEAVRIRLLLEAWTTILLVGFLAAVALFQVGQMFRLRRSAALVAVGLGVYLRYLPSESAMFFSYLTLIAGLLLFVREIVFRPAVPTSTSKK